MKLDLMKRPAGASVRSTQWPKVGFGLVYRIGVCLLKLDSFRIESDTGTKTPSKSKVKF